MGLVLAAAVTLLLARWHPNVNAERRLAAGAGAADSEMSGCAIRNVIRELRLSNGEMTQRELADRIGLTRQTVNAIERGKYSPSLETAFQIAEVFRLPLDRVFRYTKPIKPPAR